MLAAKLQRMGSMLFGRTEMVISEEDDDGELHAQILW